MKLQQFLQILAACHKSTRMHPLFIGQPLASNLEDLKEQKQNKSKHAKTTIGEGETTDNRQMLLNDSVPLNEASTFKIC
jgi:hypothetical protein